jgi:hypothetical protein
VKERIKRNIKVYVKKRENGKGNTNRKKGSSNFIVSLANEPYRSEAMVNKT